MNRIADYAKGFFTKVVNDWSMNLAGLLAYNFLGAVFPLLLGILALAALVLPEWMVNQIATTLNSALPTAVSGGLNLDFNSVLAGFRGSSGLTAVVSFWVLLWTGSNLFGVMENTFSLVFRTRGRNFIEQKLMSIGMILIFAILTPLSLAASTVSGLGGALAQMLSLVPGSEILVSLASYLVGVALAFVLFFLIYLIVPNMEMRPAHAWGGALFAAILFEIVNLIFPFYAQHFMRSSQFGPIVLLLGIVAFWFWVISLILILGAQVNSYVALGQRPLEKDLPGVIQEVQLHRDVSGVPAVAGGTHVEEPDPGFRGWLPDTRKEHVEAEEGHPSADRSGAGDSGQAPAEHGQRRVEPVREEGAEERRSGRR